MRAAKKATVTSGSGGREASAASRATEVKRDTDAIPAKVDTDAVPADTGTGGFDPASAAAARPIAQFPDIEDVLPALCERYREIAIEAAKLEKERKELSAQIMPLMEAVEWNSIEGAGWHAVRVHGARSTLSKEKLVEQGVTTAQIAKATYTTHYWYLQVRDAIQP